MLRELIERAVRVKADVVGERPARVRACGRSSTTGTRWRHAIEKVEGYRWRHGHAVAVGLVYAAALGRAGRPARRRDRRPAPRDPGCSACRSPTAADAWPDLLAAMRVDKKARGARLRFVVLDGLAQPAILDGPGDELLSEAYREVAA